MAATASAAAAVTAAAAAATAAHQAALGATRVGMGLPTLDELAGMLTFIDMMTWSQAKPEAWALMAKEMGDETLQDFGVISTITDADYVATMVKVDVGVIDRAKIMLLVRAIRAKMQPAPAPLPPPPPVLPMMPTTIVATLAESPTAKTGIMVRQVWDQASRMEVQPIAEEEIVAMRGRWKGRWGRPRLPIETSATTS